MLDTTNSLVDLDTAREFLKVTSEEDNGVVESLINRASAWANQYTGRLLKSRAHTEYQDGPCGGDHIILRQFPVTSLTSVHDDPLRAFGASTQVAAGDIYLDAENGTVELLNGVALTSGKASVKIVYTGGYAAASIPADIQEAVLIYMGHAYRREYLDQKFGVSSETIGDRTTTYSKSDVPDKAKTLLAPYRSERVLSNGF